MKDNLYWYKATIERVIDGDTFIVDEIDLGFHTSLKNQRIRLLDVDAPELRDKDEELKRLAFEAKDFVASLVEGKEIIIRSTGFDSFGRILAHVWIDGESLSNILLEKKLAIPYFRKNYTKLLKWGED